MGHRCVPQRDEIDLLASERCLVDVRKLAHPRQRVAAPSDVEQARLTGELQRFRLGPARQHRHHASGRFDFLETGP